MPVSDHELAQAVALIAHDLAATPDWDPRPVVTLAEELAGVSVDGWDAAWGEFDGVAAPRMCSSNCTTPSST
jgi:hypothetical protein